MAIVQKTTFYNIVHLLIHGRFRKTRSCTATKYIHTHPLFSYFGDTDTDQLVTSKVATSEVGV